MGLHKSDAIGIGREVGYYKGDELPLGMGGHLEKDVQNSSAPYINLLAGDAGLGDSVSRGILEEENHLQRSASSN